MACEYGMGVSHQLLPCICQVLQRCTSAAAPFTAVSADAAASTAASSTVNVCVFCQNNADTVPYSCLTNSYAVFIVASVGGHASFRVVNASGTATVGYHIPGT